MLQKMTTVALFNSAHLSIKYKGFLQKMSMWSSLASMMNSLHLHDDWIREITIYLTTSCDSLLKWYYPSDELSSTSDEHALLLKVWKKMCLINLSYLRTLTEKKLSGIPHYITLCAFSTHKEIRSSRYILV